MVVFAPCPGTTTVSSGKRSSLSFDRAQNLPRISARQVGAADAVAKQRVARDQFVLRRNPQTKCCPACGPACADTRNSAAPKREHIAIARRRRWSVRAGALHPEPGRLHVQMIVELLIVLRS